MNFLSKFFLRQKYSIIKLLNSPLRRINIAKIKDIHNKYYGKRCFIVGGSPSLKRLDLTKLCNEYTFTTGKGFKLRELGLEHSTFHVMSDTTGYIEEENNIPLDFSDIFFTSQNVPFNKAVKTSIRFRYTDLGIENFRFEGDLLKPLYAAQTVITFAMAIAFYLGFKQVILIGVDCDFKENIAHAYRQTEGEAERQKAHSAEVKNKMLSGIRISANEMIKAGVSVINASPAGIVDFIPRVGYEEILSQKYTQY